MSAATPLVSSALPGPGEREPLVRAALAALPAGCWWVPGHREWPLATLRGVPEARLADPSAGAAPYKVAPVSDAPALRALYAVGLAAASGRPVVVHLGDGALADGAFAEAMNLAVTLAAPALFVIATRDLSGAPVPVQGPRASALAAAWGLEWVMVSDAGAVGDALRAQIAAGRPAVLELRLGAGT